MEKKREEYVAPEVLIIECQVEKGYASTDTIETFSIGEEVKTASTKDWWFD